MDDSVGALVKRKRGQLKLTQEGLAERIEARDRTYITRLENGHPKLPGHDIRVKLAEVLGISEIELLIAAGELDAQALERYRVGGGQTADIVAAIERLDRDQLNLLRVILQELVRPHGQGRPNGRR